VLGRRAADLALSSPGQQLRRTENLVKNATRIVETLGDMKGAAMKIGQMLSLYEGMLPPEVAEVLQTLQREAPRAPAEVMRYELEGSLGGSVEEFLSEFEPEAFAAASIGQVHRGRLLDGRDVAIKIQYPLISEIVRADLKNLKRLLGSLFAMAFEVDFEPIWGELKDRLLEELDYEHEAANIRRMSELHAAIPEIVIPSVIEELSTDRVLVMERVEGIRPRDACSTAYSAEQKSQWGEVLFEFQFRGLFEHRLLHADPNLANFAFLEGGQVVVYDFGCLKRVPADVAAGYSGVVRAVMEGRRTEVPDALMRLGLHKKGPTPLPQEVIDPYIDLLGEILRASPTYAFGEDPDFYGRIMELGMANWSHSVDMQFPQDVVFIDRSLAGHFGNLTRLGAAGPWRRIVEHYANLSI